MADDADGTGGFRRIDPQIGGFRRSAPPPNTSRVAALWQGLLRGGRDILEGGAQIGARMGPEEGAAAFTNPADLAARRQAVDQSAQQSNQAYQQNPARQAHPFIAGASRLAGNVAPSLLPMGIPGGASLSKLPSAAGAAARALAGLGDAARFAGGAGGAMRSGLGRLASGAATGAATAGMQPVTGGDFWAEKAKQIGFGAAAGAALPAAGSMLSPRLPDYGLVAQKVSRLFRPMWNFATGAEERTVNGFDRTIAREVLSPIGGDVKGRVSGHDLIEAVQDQINKAYDKILPNIALTRAGAQNFGPKLLNEITELAPDDATRFSKILNNRLWNKFPASGPMAGRELREARTDLMERASNLRGTNGDDIGRALEGVITHLNETIEKENPQFAPELKKASAAWRGFVRMQMAASGATSKGEFTPADLLRSIRRQDPTQGGFASGDAIFQRYAEAADAAMGQRPASVRDLLHIFSRHGLLMQIPEQIAGPTARAGKMTASVTSPIAGAIAGEIPKRRDPYVSSSGP
jgi:hypothetical protein